MDGLDFVAIDFETANAKRSSACSIGLAFVENGELVDSKHYLIKPTPNHYDIHNMRVHRLTEADTEHAPTFDKLWGEIAPMIEGKVLVAHSAAFDLNVLFELFVAYNISAPLIKCVCSCVVAEDLYPDLADHKLKTVCSHLGYEFDNHHNAEADAVAAAMVLIGEVKACKCTSIDVMLEKVKVHPGIIIDGHCMPCRSRRVKKKSQAKSKTSPNNIFGERLSGEILKAPDLGAIENKNTIFFGKRVLITGVTKTDRKELAALFKSLGADMQSSISRKIEIVILGVAPGPAKMKQLEAYLAEGAPITVMSEDEALAAIPATT